MQKPQSLPLRLSCGQSRIFGRSEGTRTPGILLPKQARYQLRYTPIYLIFYFVNLVNFDITIRCASIKNIVALLAWSASHCSLFFHLRASPESSAGRGEPLRPTALHPDIFDFYFVILAKHSITVRCLHENVLNSS